MFAGGRCPICGTEGAACGGPTTMKPVELVERMETKMQLPRGMVLVQHGPRDIRQYGYMEALEIEKSGRGRIVDKAEALPPAPLESVGPDVTSRAVPLGARGGRVRTDADVDMMMSGQGIGMDETAPAAQQEAPDDTAAQSTTQAVTDPSGAAQEQTEASDDDEDDVSDEDETDDDSADEYDEDDTDTKAVHGPPDDKSGSRSGGRVRSRPRGQS